MPLSHDLAKLYLKLGRGESAVRVLEQALHDKTSLSLSSNDGGGEGKGGDEKTDLSMRGGSGARSAAGADVDDMRQDVLTLLLLVTVKEKTDGYSPDDVSNSLRQARVRQTDVISALRSGGAGKDTGTNTHTPTHTPTHMPSNPTPLTALSHTGYSYYSLHWHQK